MLYYLRVFLLGIAPHLYMLWADVIERAKDDNYTIKVNWQPSSKAKMSTTMSEELHEKKKKVTRKAGWGRTGARIIAGQGKRTIIL